MLLRTEQSKVNFRSKGVHSPKYHEFGKFAKTYVPEILKKDKKRPKNARKKNTEIIDHIEFDMIHQAIVLIEVKSCENGIPRKAYKQFRTAEKYFRKLWCAYGNKMNCPNVEPRIVSIVFLWKCLDTPETILKKSKISENKNGTKLFDAKVKVFTQNDLNPSNFKTKYCKAIDEISGLWNDFVALCISVQEMNVLK